MAEKKKPQKTDAPAKKERHLPSGKELKDGLEAIYAERDGAMPDLTHLQRADSSHLTRFLVKTAIVLLVLAAAGWAGFLAWSKLSIFDRGGGLEATVEAPASARSGEETEIAIRYRNEGKVPLASLEAKLSLPPGFDVRSATPPATEGTTWTLGSLSPGSDGEIRVAGVFRAEVPSTQTVQAFLTYRPANFSSDFQDIHTAETAIEASALELTASGPERALVGDEVRYEITLRNDGEDPVERVAIRAELPEDFSVAATEPESASEDAAEWALPEILPGDEETIEIIGAYSSTADGQRQLVARAVLLEEDNVSLLQREERAFTDVIAGDLSFRLVVNGSAEDQDADLGESLRATIDYANNTDQVIQGLSFDLRTDGRDGKPVPIEWEAATLEEGVRQGGILRWDSEVREELERLDPGGSGTIDVSLPLPSSIDPARFADELTLSLSARLAQVGSLEESRTIDATPITIGVNTDLTATAEARYFDHDGAQVGTGPLPPKVGETTGYRVYWTIDTALHPLRDATMSTNLPPDVAWRDVSGADVGSVEFNREARLVTWKIGDLPADQEAAQGWFDVTILPEDGDENAFFKLTNATSADAADASTDGRLSTAIDILTTELPTDELASGKGVVEK